jgi:hypothetical protein
VPIRCCTCITCRVAARLLKLNCHGHLLERVTRVRRKRAVALLDAFLTDPARSLNNLSSRLADLGPRPQSPRYKTTLVPGRDRLGSRILTSDNSPFSAGIVAPRAMLPE